MKIITFSKPMKRKNASENKTIFPAPPLHPKDIGLVLKHKVHVFAHQFDSLGPAQKVASLGGMGGSTATVNVVGLEKIWIPSEDDSDTGTWRQETFFSSTLILQCTPTFCSQTLSTEVRSLGSLRLLSILSLSIYISTICMSKCVLTASSTPWKPKFPLKLVLGFRAQETVPHVHNDLAA